MRKHVTLRKIKKNDKRTADDFIREWCDHVGGVRAGERLAEVYRGNISVWLHDPDRRFTPDVTRKVSRASGLPCEALMFRWEAIGTLDLWKFVGAFK